jgi:hypothetical protein
MISANIVSAWRELRHPAQQSPASLGLSEV